MKIRNQDKPGMDEAARHEWRVKVLMRRRHAMDRLDVEIAELDQLIRVWKAARPLWDENGELEMELLYERRAVLSRRYAELRRVA